MNTAHFFPPAQLGPGCRYPAVDACDPGVLNVGTLPTLINPAPLVLLKGEIIDVGLEWLAWGKKNCATIKTSSWVAHAQSPQAPTLQVPVTLFNETTQSTVAVLNLTAATLGDTYWLENTVVFKSDPVGAFQMPERTLRRTVAVRVGQ
jgi:hypothetical protein